MTFELSIDNIEEIKALMGPNNINIKTIEDIYGASLNIVGTKVYLDMTDNLKRDQLVRLINKLVEVIKIGAKISPRDIVYLANLVASNEEQSFNKLYFIRTIS